MRPQKHLYIFIFFAILASLFYPIDTHSAEPKRVLITPFNINAEKDYTFLRDGIFDMLSTRLSLPDKIILIDKTLIYNEIKDMPGRLSQEDVLALGEKFQADYVLFGSLTLFGNSLSTDARLFDTAQNKTILAYDETGEKPGDVIEHIDLFADQVKADVFGEKPTVAIAPPPKQTAPDSRQHPDELLKPGATVVAPTVAPQPGAAPTLTMQRSRRFKDQIRGITTGDIDGEGGNELIFIGKRTIYVFRYVDNLFQKVREIEGARNHRYLSVDAADINGNGRVEIFVSAVSSDNTTMTSFVLEWDGKKFVDVTSRSKWYYRVIDMPGRGDVLIGQKRGSVNAFSPAIHELTWKADGYEPADRITIPKPTNVYGFSYGEALNDGRNVWLVTSDYNILQIVDDAGQEEWKSSEKYGANDIFIDFRSDLENPIVQGEKDYTRYYLPNRMFITDLDNDGKKEVLVTKNVDKAGGLLRKSRIFDKGAIECLAWDGIGLYPKWKSREVSGYISDFTLVDIDNDGRKELALSVVADPGTGLTKPKSYIVTIDPNQPPS